MKYIRPWRLDDASSLAENANDVSVWNNVRDYFPNPYSGQDAVDFITMSLAMPRTLNFAIEVDGRAVGGIGFVPGQDIERLSAEVGYWLGSDYRGRGIMSGAVRELVGYIFENTGIVRLFAPVFASNKASQRVLEKAGFRLVGTMRKAAVKNGELMDMRYYELVK